MCHSSSHSDSRTALRKVHSLPRVAPYTVSRDGIVPQSELVRIRRSWLETAPEVDPLVWRPPVTSGRSVPLRTATTLHSTGPGTHTCGLAGRVNRSALLRFVLRRPGRAEPPIRA